MRPVELSSPASTYLRVHIHVHIRYTLSIFSTSACSLASLFSRIFSIYRFLTFLALGSRLLLLLDFDMEFFRSHKHHTGCDSCHSTPLSVSLRFFPRASLDFVIGVWRRCSPLSLVSFSFLFHHTTVTFMHANYYPPFVYTGKSPAV